VSLTHLLLLKFVGLLATISSLLLHLKISKQICTGNIADGTTSVLELLFPSGRQTIRESLVKLILSEW
jgi:hypothetical protein